MSSKKIGYVDIAKFISILLLVLAGLLSWRFHQRSLNSQILAYDYNWWEESIFYTDYSKTYHAGFMNKFSEIKKWDTVFRGKNDEISEYSYLKLFSNLKLYKYDVKYIKTLMKGRNKNNYRIVHWYMNRKMIPDMIDYQDHKNYEMARYIAQRYLNILKELPPSDFFNNISKPLSKVRFVLEYQSKSFPYNENNIRDMVEYETLASSHDNSPQRWEKFYQKYSQTNSKRLDDAKANIINYTLNHSNLSDSKEIESVVSMIDSSILNSELSSYLEDDYYYYSLILSSKIYPRSRIIKKVKYFIEQYNDTDHYKRLIYNISLYISKKYGFDIDNTVDTVELLFSNYLLETDNLLKSITFNNKINDHRKVNGLVLFLNENSRKQVLSLITDLVIKFSNRRMKNG